MLNGLRPKVEPVSAADMLDSSKFLFREDILVSEVELLEKNTISFGIYFVFERIFDDIT
jgi:hypothetical protein